MQNITKNARYAEAHKTLDELTSALSAASAEETRLLELLTRSDEVFSPLQAGLRLLRGEPAQRNDSLGLNRELVAVRERQDVLRPAVTSQRSVVHALVTELSASACAEAVPAHTKAVQGVADALQNLRTALDAEAAVRNGIEAAGFACTLPAVQHPQINLADTEQPASRLLKDAMLLLEVRTVASMGDVNVRLLIAVSGIGEPGDVVKMAGRGAALLIQFGQAERTAAKPSKASRPDWRMAEGELVLS